MSSNVLPPPTCSGTTCSPSSTPSPPLPHQQSTSEAIPDDPHFSQNGLQARGRVVRCYLQVCYVMTEPDTVSTTVTTTDTPISTSPATLSPHGVSPEPSGTMSFPLGFESMDIDALSSNAKASVQSDPAARTRGDFAYAATSSSGLAVADHDPAKAATVLRAIFMDAAVPIPTFNPTLADPAIAIAPSLPARDVAASSSDNVSLSTTPTPTSSSAPSTSSTPRSGLSAAAIVRIAIGAGVGAGFLAIALICLVARWRNKRRAARLAAARRKPFAGSEAYGMASRGRAEEGHGVLGRASSDSNTVIDHDGYSGEEFGMAGGAHGRKDRERV